MTTLPTSRPLAPVAWEGCRNSLAVIVAYLPFGLALGAALASTGVPKLLAWSTSPLLFGGAAQLVSVQSIAAGANAVVVVLSTLVVNARMLLYSASLAPHTAAWPARWRWAGAYLLADPVFALAMGRFGRPDRGGRAQERLAYYLTVGLTLWVGWQAITGAGILLAGALPAGLRLELAAPLTFLLLLLPMVTNRAKAVAAAASAAVAVAASGLPLGLGPLVGAAVGVAIGAVMGGRNA